jgi:signal transduction histidine kinase
MIIKSYKTKALAVMIPLLVSMSLIYTFESIMTEKEIIRSEIIKRAESVTSLATKSGELPLLSGNPELLKNTVSFLRANSEVSAVTFYDRNMNLLIHSGQPILHPHAVPPSNTPISMIEEGNAFVFFAPVSTLKIQEDFDIIHGSGAVRDERETIGWIRLGFSKASMRTNERRIVSRGLLLAFLFASGSSLLVYILINLAMRQLKKIVTVANEIARGDLSSEMMYDHQDEIGILARAFSRMKNTIRQVLGETDSLILAVQDGKLDTRSNAEAFEGEWRNLVDGVNNLTAAFAGVHAEMRAAKEAAESASRAKSDFLSSMSHELRTPLNAIMGYAQILKREENLTETQRMQLEIMYSSGDHLLMLINDILDVGKIEARKMDIEEVPFDLHALMRQVVNLTKLSAEEKGLQFQYVADTTLPYLLRGDERKLRQILLNLLSNAVKYTHEGSVTLRVSYGQSEPGLLYCEVVDTGTGIPSDMLEAVFEPFTQLTTNRQVRQGTGLGLNITRQLTTLMHGNLGVESEVGKGSKFWLEVVLPLVKEDKNFPEKMVQTYIGYQGKRKKVLIVDDNDINRSMLLALLESLGFDVAIAGNGLAALWHMTDSQPDLVILDLVMPEMDGLDTVRAMRQRPELEGVAIIGASAMVTDTARREYFAAECDAFVEKPIRIDLFLERISEQLGLEWICALPRLSGVIEERNDDYGVLPIEAPPQDELKMVYELALMGNVREIQAWALQQEKDCPKYGRFTGKLRELAGAFKTKAILELLERYYEGEK